MGSRGVLTGQLAHAAVDLGLEARLTVSAIAKSQLQGETSKKSRQGFDAYKPQHQVNNATEQGHKRKSDTLRLVSERHRETLRWLARQELDSHP